MITFSYCAADVSKRDEYSFRKRASYVSQPRVLKTRRRHHRVSLPLRPSFRVQRHRAVPNTQIPLTPVETRFGGVRVRWSAGTHTRTPHITYTYTHNCRIDFLFSRARPPANRRRAYNNAPRVSFATVPARRRRTDNATTAEPLPFYVYVVVVVVVVAQNRLSLPAAELRGLLAND